MEMCMEWVGVGVFYRRDAMDARFSNGTGKIFRRMIRS
jgi:hypothetical protein